MPQRPLDQAAGDQRPRRRRTAHRIRLETGEGEILVGSPAPPARPADDRRSRPAPATIDVAGAEVRASHLRPGRRRRHPPPPRGPARGPPHVVERGRESVLPLPAPPGRAGGLRLPAPPPPGPGEAETPCARSSPSPPSRSSSPSSLAEARATHPRHRRRRPRLGLVRRRQPPALPLPARPGERLHAAPRVPRPGDRAAAGSSTCRSPSTREGCASSRTRRRFRPCILTVGDSMTFGEGVPDGRHLLGACSRGGSGCASYNAGVPGYSSAQMLGRLRRYLPVLQPRGGGDDPLPALGPPALRRPLRLQGRLHRGPELRRPPRPARRQPLPARDPAPRPRHRHRLRRALLEPDAPGPPRPGRRRPQAVPPPAEQTAAGAADVEPTVRNLQAARQLAIAREPASWPCWSTTGARLPRATARLLQARLRALGIPCVAADDLLPAARWPRLRYPLDTHWNAAGHAAVGQALAPRIKPLLVPSG